MKTEFETRSSQLVDDAGSSGSSVDVSISFISINEIKRN